MRIILYQPQIPQNTGNIVRSCAVTGSSLTLITPLGFSTSSRQLRRAGLDYWEGVDVEQTDDLESILASTSSNFTFFSSHSKIKYTDLEYKKDDILIFGSETSGLPSSLYERWPHHSATLPMLPGARCLNLASSVAIVLYEAWRQQGFAY